MAALYLSCSRKMAFESAFLLLNSCEERLEPASVILQCLDTVVGTVLKKVLHLSKKVLLTFLLFH